MLKLSLVSLLALSLLLCASTSTAAQDAQLAALQKFQDDAKAAAASGSISQDQFSRVQQSVATLGTYRMPEKPGASIDLLTPYHAIAALKFITANPNLKLDDKEALQRDLHLIIDLISQSSTSSALHSVNPNSALAKDILAAVLKGSPAEEQVKQLQDDLNQLQQTLGVTEAKIALRSALKKARLNIAEIMNSNSFLETDRDTVLEDLTALDPHGAKRAN